MARRFISILLSIIVLTSLYFFIDSAINIHSTVAELNDRSTAEHAAKRVILIAQELDTPYWKLLKEGAAEQAKSYGYMLQYVGPQRHDPDEQTRLLQKAIAAKPDAIITQGLQGQEALFELAQDSGIAMIAIDTDVETSSRIAYVGTDNELAGKQLAQLMLSKIKQKELHVGVIIGSYAHNQSERLAAFQNALADQQHIELVEVRTSNISRLQAAEMTVDLLQQYPHINVFVGLSGLDAIGIVDGLDAAGHKDIAVFGFDNLLNTESLIQQGRIVGSIVQQPDIIGQQAIEVLHHSMEGMPYAEQNFISTYVLTAEQQNEVQR